MSHDNRPLWRTPGGFAETHCRQCAAGWTRTGPEGSVLIVCLLDREPIVHGLTGCDRFQVKDGQAA